jgi:uncharacterized protein (TIGR03437 family)
MVLGAIPVRGLHRIRTSRPSATVIPSTKTNRVPNLMKLRLPTLPRKRTRPASMALLSSFFFLLIAAPALAQSTLNLSEDLIRLGIAPSNMVPNQPTLDAGPLLLAGVNYAQANQIPTVIADKGAYYFSSLQQPSVHVGLGAPRNLTIDLQGSDLYFTHILANGIATGGTNLTLQNFTIDYLPLPFTQVQVTSVNAAQESIQYAPLPGWSDPGVFNSLQGSNGWDGDVEVHMFRSGRPSPGTKRMGTNPPFAGNSFSLINYGFQPGPSDFANIRPGDIAVMSVRFNATGLLVSNCTGCTIRNVTTYSSPSDGMDVSYSPSGTVERVYGMPRPGTDRLVSVLSTFTLANSDNSAARLNRGIRNMDDAFGFVQWIVGIVQSQPATRAVTIAGTFATLVTQGQTIPTGSSVEFQSTSAGAMLGSAVIVSQTAMPQSPPFQVTYTFDRDIPANLTGAAMYDNDPNRGNIVMQANAVEEQTSCCRGVSIWGYGNSSFTGNYVQRAALSGVNLYERLNPMDWQTPPFLNMNVSNNVIDQPNSTVNAYPELQLGGVDLISEGAQGLPFTLSTNQSVNITNNLVADPGDPAVWFGDTNAGSISGNYFLSPNNNPTLISTVGSGWAGIIPGLATLLTEPVVVWNSTGIVTANNVVDQASGRMWVTDTQYNELAAYAPGSTCMLNAYNLGTLAGPSITLTDSGGTNWPVAISKTATHALDLVLPASAALGGAYFTLTSGSVKYFGTLFLDSQDDIPAVNGCSYEVGLSSTSVPATANSLPILVVTQGGCSYQALNEATLASMGPAATGTGVVNVSFPANTGPSQTITIEIAGQQFTVSQAALPSLSVSSQAVSFSAVAGQDPAAQSITISIGGSAAGTIAWSVAVSTSAGGNWLSASPTSGTTGATLQVAVHVAGLAAGSYNGTITIVAPGAQGSPASIAVTLTITPLATVQAIYDPWNYTTGIAPGAWVAISGVALTTGAPQTWNVTGSQLPTFLSGVTLTFNGMPAALLYASATQINALVPASVMPGPVQVIVESNGVAGASYSATAAATLPAIYAPASADGSAFYVTAPLEGTGLLTGNSAVDPRVLRAAQPGDTLDVYMVGLGATADPTKFITNQNFAGAFPVSATVTATIGGESAADCSPD